MSAAGGTAASFMALAVREAEKGLGHTSPNPAVGAVVVRDGQVIARGYHARAGAPHAEAMALAEAGPAARGADLYVTLEPCDHWGRTPPCSRAILEAGIARVFVGSRDPNPVVNGRGIARLRRAGVEVTTAVLERECDALNTAWLRAWGAPPPPLLSQAAQHLPLVPPPGVRAGRGSHR